MGFSWKIKAIIQRTVSLLPFKERLNFFLQTKISRTIPISAEQMIGGKGKRALNHLDIISNHTSINFKDAVFYEFGAGWDLGLPLVFYAAGINSQLLVDIEDHARLSLVNDMVAKINGNIEKVFEGSGLTYRMLPAESLSEKSQLKTAFGIDYKAPLDARKTGMPTGTIDAATNTFTLEHIPAQDIRDIFTETYRILKPGGVVSCFVDMQDHYAYFDSKVTVYNYLQFTEREWKKYNCDLHYQNRMRHPEYIDIFKSCGFEIIHEELNKPSEKDMQVLKTMNIEKAFTNRFSLEEIGIRSSKVLLRKPL
jgi:predicted SAM-dependent methyltransferase